MAADALDRQREAGIRRLRQRRYDGTSMALHWLTAILVLVQVTAGLIMASLGSGPAQNALYFTHKSLGVTLLLLVLFRLAWKIGHPWPPLPADVPGGQAGLARTNHVLLYATLLVMAVSGFVFTSAGGFPVPFWGMIDLSGWIAKDPDLSKWVEAVHVFTQWVLYALVALHVAGTFYHLLVRKDGVFQRMWPH